MTQTAVKLRKVESSGIADLIASSIQRTDFRGQAALWDEESGVFLGKTGVIESVAGSLIAPSRLFAADESAWATAQLQGVYVNMLYHIKINVKTKGPSRRYCPGALRGCNECNNRLAVASDSWVYSADFALARALRASDLAFRAVALAAFFSARAASASEAVAFPGAKRSRSLTALPVRSRR